MMVDTKVPTIFYAIINLQSVGKGDWLQSKPDSQVDKEAILAETTIVSNLTNLKIFLHFSTNIYFFRFFAIMYQ